MAPSKPKHSKRKSKPAGKRAVERAIDNVKSAARHTRFLKIADMVAEQWTGQQIVRAIADQFTISIRQAHFDLAEVYAQCRADSSADQEIRISRARLTWQRRMRLCELKGDQAAANYALDRLCKLDGLYAPKKIEVGGTVGVVVQMRTVLSALDAIGLAALDVVMQQLALRGIGGLPGMVDVPALAAPSSSGV